MRATDAFITGGEHIGVITPYHAQRCKILDLLYKDPKFRDIKVGSVEEFQGQVRVSLFRFVALCSPTNDIFLVGTTRYHHIDGEK